MAGKSKSQENPKSMGFPVHFNFLTPVAKFHKLTHHMLLHNWLLLHYQGTGKIPRHS